MRTIGWYLRNDPVIRAKRLSLGVWVPEIPCCVCGSDTKNPSRCEECENEEPF